VRKLVQLKAQSYKIIFDSYNSFRPNKSQKLLKLLWVQPVLSSLHKSRNIFLAIVRLTHLIKTLEVIDLLISFEIYDFDIALHSRNL